MDREYRIFECLMDGSLLWRAIEYGLANTQFKLQALSKKTPNDLFAVHFPSREFVFLADSNRKGPLMDKRVFQIAYTEELRVSRAAALRSHGYGAISVIGNEAAKAVLSSGFQREGDFDLFIIGHAAAGKTRKDLLDWLKTKYPHAKILALNPLDQTLPGADYNVIQNGPEKWLPLIG